MSHPDPSAGGDDAASHRYFCRQCATTTRMDPPALICPICQGRLIDESDLPSSSSSSTTSRPLVPDAAPFVPLPPTSRATISRSAIFEHRDLNSDSLRIISESGFFSSPYPNSLPLFTPSPAAGSVITLLFLRRYINFCSSEGARINTNVLQRQITRLFEDYINSRAAHSALSVPQSAILLLPDFEMTEDFLASDEAQCPVCTENFKIGEEVKQLPCNHVYHKNCIVPWLEIRNSCPVCRSKLKPGDLNYTGRRGSGEQNTVEQRPFSMATRFEIELLWPVESRFSRLRIRGSEDGRRSGGGGQGDGEDSGGNEGSRTEG